MATPIQFKRSGTPGKVPTTSDIVVGEIAINFADGKIYSNDGTSIVALGGQEELGGREFDTGKNYLAGDIVTYGGKVYVFKVDHSAGAWDPTEVAAATEGTPADHVVMSGYTKPAAGGAINDTDTVDVAIGKLEKGLENATAGGIKVEDSLTSTSTVDALSANQGRILKDTIDALPKPTTGKAWVSGTDYKTGDIVVQNGIAFMSLKDQTSITPPSNGADWTDSFIVSNIDPGTF